MRFETADGRTLETKLRKLKVYLESHRERWPIDNPGEDFENWATGVLRGALGNLATDVAAVVPAPRLCSTCGKGRRYGGLTLCYSCQTHG